MRASFFFLRLYSDGETAASGEAASSSPEEASAVGDGADGGDAAGATKEVVGAGEGADPLLCCVTDRFERLLCRLISFLAAGKSARRHRRLSCCC